MKRLSLQGHGRSVLAAMDTIEVVRGPPSPIFGMGKIGGYIEHGADSPVRARTAAISSSRRASCRRSRARTNRDEWSFGVGGPLALRARSRAGTTSTACSKTPTSFIARRPVGQRRAAGPRASTTISSAPFRLEAGANYAALAHRRRADGPPHAGARRTPAAISAARRSWTSTRTATARSAISKCSARRRCEGRMSVGQPAAASSTSPGRRTRTASRCRSISFRSVAGIPQSIYDYLVQHPEADPTGAAARAGTGRADADLGLRADRHGARSAHRRLRHARSAPRRRLRARPARRNF